MAGDRLEVLIDAKLGNVEQRLEGVNKLATSSGKEAGTRYNKSFTQSMLIARDIDKKFDEKFDKTTTEAAAAGKSAGEKFADRFGEGFQRLTRRGLIVAGVVQGLRLAGAAMDYFAARADFATAQATGGITDVIKSAESMKTAIAAVPFVGGVAADLAGRLTGYNKAVSTMAESMAKGQDAIARRLAVGRIESVSAPTLDLQARELLGGVTTETMRDRIALQMADLEQKFRERRTAEENRLAGLGVSWAEEKSQMALFGRGEAALRGSAERLLAAQFSMLGNGGIAGNYNAAMLSLSRPAAPTLGDDDVKRILAEIRDRMPQVGSTN